MYTATGRYQTPAGCFELIDKYEGTSTSALRRKINFWAEGNANYSEVSKHICVEKLRKILKCLYVISYEKHIYYS